MTDDEPLDGVHRRMTRQGMGALEPEDGRRAPRGVRRAGRGDHAGRGQHPALRAAPRRRVGGARRDASARSGRPCTRIPDRLSVGIDINATHHRAATCGTVTGVATPLHLGRTMASYEIVITDERDRRVCTCRITCALLPEDQVPG